MRGCGNDYQNTNLWPGDVLKWESDRLAIAYEEFRGMDTSTKDAERDTLQNPRRRKRGESCRVQVPKLKVPPID